MDGPAAGRQPAGSNHPTAEAGRIVRARREGGVPFLRAYECHPAIVAGCRKIAMVTPPATAGEEGINPHILVAAAEAGVREIYRAGGAQAVAALAYGTESIQPVDKIVGPGNIYVALAKRFVFGVVDIDMIAGPTDIVVLADEHADPEYVAADLLAQAEHDEMSPAILVTTSQELAESVRLELWRQLDAAEESDRCGLHSDQRSHSPRGQLGRGR